MKHFGFIESFESDSDDCFTESDITRNSHALFQNLIFSIIIVDDRETNSRMYFVTLMTTFVCVFFPLKHCVAFNVFNYSCVIG
jgi:hypothetical protein